jgi:hypothetical protein
MAWNPKTKIGKVLKTTLQIGGGVLGLATGLNVGSAALGAVSRVVTKGTAALSKTDNLLSNISNATDKVATASKILQAGVLKKANLAIADEKEAARLATEQLAGETNETKPATTVTDFFKGQNSKYVLYGAAALSALFIIPKLLKRR